MSLGLHAAAAGEITGLEEVALRALTKLEQVMPSRLRRRLSALHASIVPLGRRGPTVDAPALAAIAGACRDQEQLAFSYRGADGAGSQRKVEPAGLVHAGARWYLVAWDLDRRDWRTFRVNRIASKLTSKCPGRALLPAPAPRRGPGRLRLAQRGGGALPGSARESCCTRPSRRWRSGSRRRRARWRAPARAPACCTPGRPRWTPWRSGCRCSAWSSRSRSRPRPSSTCAAWQSAPVGPRDGD